MKNDSLILKNKDLPAAIEAVVDRETDTGNEVIFVIVGDLDLKGKYAPTALIFTWDSVIYVNAATGEESRFMFSDMREVVAKRMYGNATLSALMPDGKRVVFFRYTYSVASLCDAAALFINHIRDGEERNEELAIMAVTFERALSICPKCGRTLLHPGAECIMCRSKLKIVKQLSKYIVPQLKTDVGTFPPVTRAQLAALAGLMVLHIQAHALPVVDAILIDLPLLHPVGVQLQPALTAGV